MQDELRSRLADSVETALRLGGGVMLVADITEAELAHDRLFSERFACPACGISLPEIEPRTFSFNSPHGACPACTGLGSQMEFDPDLLVPDKSLSLAGGAVKPWDRDTQTIYHAMLQSVAEHHQIPFDVPVAELSQAPDGHHPPRRQEERHDRDQIRQPGRPRSLLPDELRGRDPEPAAALPRDHLRLHPQRAGALHDQPALPDLRRQTPAARGAGRHRPRPEHRRGEPLLDHRVAAMGGEAGGRQRQDQDRASGRIGAGVSGHGIGDMRSAVRNARTHASRHHRHDRLRGTSPARPRRSASANTRSRARS